MLMTIIESGPNKQMDSMFVAICYNVILYINCIVSGLPITSHMQNRLDSAVVSHDSNRDHAWSI